MTIRILEASRLTAVNLTSEVTHARQRLSHAVAQVTALQQDLNHLYQQHSEGYAIEILGKFCIIEWVIPFLKLPL